VVTGYDRGMRKADIAALFDYNYWANARILEAAARVTPEEFVASSTPTIRNLRSTLVHTLDVEWSWRLRLKGEDRRLWETALPDEDYPTVAPLAEHWMRDETEMRPWLDELGDEDLAGTPDLGNRQSIPLWYFLVHIISHGMQQRADAATLLTLYGQSPGELEFLNYADWARR
jgi:uncharacterized damage-inducible protein DinB